MQDAPKTEKRKDSRGRVLRTGESQRPDGSYQFRWSEAGQRRTRYAPTLEELRQKEDEIAYLTGGVLDHYERVLQKEVIAYDDIF